MEEKLNFAGLTGEYSELEKAKIVILPVPFDKTSFWLRGWTEGSEKGPEAIIKASQYMELYDIETDFSVCEKGIYTAEPIGADSSKELVETVEAEVARLSSKGKFTVILGGEHTVSIGAIRAHAKQGVLTVVQLDAHTDLRDEYNEDPLSHASVMARAREVADIVQVGIRSMDDTELEKTETGKIFYAKDLWNTESWIEEAVRSAGQKVYVTIDLDVFDTGIMPSTGSPEPGGLQWYQVLKFLKRLAEEKEIVGFDLVELSPNPQNKAPDFLAAKLVYAFLSYIFCRRE
ncbi:MAG: agmatinase [Candidatus Aenigmarchaeota archaeon]|nr:agmatinase [Candidatus Aenigmarchaeota archaeon]